MGFLLGLAIGLFVGVGSVLSVAFKVGATKEAFVLLAVAAAIATLLAAWRAIVFLVSPARIEFLLWRVRFRWKHAHWNLQGLQKWTWTLTMATAFIGVTTWSAQTYQVSVERDSVYRAKVAEAHELTLTVEATAIARRTARSLCVLAAVAGAPEFDAKAAALNKQIAQYHKQVDGMIELIPGQSSATLSHRLYDLRYVVESLGETLGDRNTADRYVELLMEQALASVAFSDVTSTVTQPCPAPNLRPDAKQLEQYVTQATTSLYWYRDKSNEIREIEEPDHDAPLREQAIQAEEYLADFDRNLKRDYKAAVGDAALRLFGERP
jgi:hypothetical protein